MVPAGFIERKDIKGPPVHILQDQAGGKLRQCTATSTATNVSLGSQPGISQPKTLMPFPLSLFFQPGRPT